KEDEVVRDATYDVQEVAGTTVVTKAVPALTALNERLRDDYIREVQAGVDRWNRVINRTGVPVRLTLPHKGFHRGIGNFAGHFISPDGRVVSEAEWKKHEFEWLPSPEDRAYVQSLMTGRVVEPGKFANGIAPPRAGINNQPLNFEYVRFNWAACPTPRASLIDGRSRPSGGIRCAAPQRSS